MMQLIETIDMSKEKTKPGPGGPGRKPMIVQMRGSHQYKEWAERLARFDGMTLSTLVDRALRRYAKEIGFDEAPPQR